MSAKPYCFFLSYAREDKEWDHAGTIPTFYRDLVEAIRVRTNWPVERVGFMETAEIVPGTRWPPKLSAELATCRAFVPILSPTYFDRTFCGQEWAVFEERLQASPDASGQPPPLIQPVQFVAPEHLTGMPAVVADVQNTFDKYPAAYSRLGLQQLAGLEPREYKQFVAAFADALKAAVKAHPLPPSAPVSDIRTVVSAFQKPGTHVTATHADAVPTGPRFAQFFFVAASRSELLGVRQDLEPYGDAGEDWQPYLPELSDEVAIIAQEVAAREKLRYESLPLDDDFIAAIKEAVKRNKIVVVLVDSWTVRLARYKELMVQLDGHDFDNCVVIVPWNLKDPETTATRDVLVQAIQATFIKARRRDPKSFVESTKSYREFKNELAKSLAAARGRIIDNRQVVRRAESAGVFVNPSFTAPPTL